MTTLRHRLRVLEALALLLAARALRSVVPMKYWSRVLGRPGPPVAADARPGSLSGAEKAVARAVLSAARRVRGNCLEQAFAASVMLRVRRRRSVVVLGLDREDPTAVPHAWLIGASRTVVLGGEVMGSYQPVNQFGALS